MSKTLFNLSKLNKNEIDFYYFTLENINLLLFSTVQDIAKKYGCGISFIYNFFNTINVSGLKEYIYKLGYFEGYEGKDVYEEGEKNIWNKNISKVSHQNIKKYLMFNYKLDNEINLNLIEKQSDLINDFCKEIKKSKKIYGFGIGHAEICINELFGMFEHFGLKCEQFLKRDGEKLPNISEIEENDIFILYTLRGIHKFTKNLLKKIREKLPNLNIWIITSNPESKFIKLATKCIFINNNTRNMDYLANTLFISPASPFLMFNDYLKNYYYLNNIEELNKKSGLMSELEGLRSREN